VLHDYYFIQSQAVHKALAKLSVHSLGPCGTSDRNFVTSFLRALGTTTAATPESNQESSAPVGAGGKTSFEGLSDREVLRLLAEGLSNEAIGGRLFISVGTAI
jgi:DNA-binding NarL/FixJ family response regulator